MDAYHDCQKMIWDERHWNRCKQVKKKIKKINGMSHGNKLGVMVTCQKQVGKNGQVKTHWNN